MTLLPCKNHYLPSQNRKIRPFFAKTCPAASIFALQEDNIFIVGRVRPPKVILCDQKTPPLLDFF